MDQYIANFERMSNFTSAHSSFSDLLSFSVLFGSRYLDILDRTDVNKADALLFRIIS